MMALSPAERQRRYRQNRPEANHGEGERRLNTWLSTASVLALKRIAAHENTSQREVLEKLILQADEENLRTLDSNDEGFNTYLNRTGPGNHAHQPRGQHNEKNSHE